MRTVDTLGNDGIVIPLNEVPHLMRRARGVAPKRCTTIPTVRHQIYWHLATRSVDKAAELTVMHRFDLLANGPHPPEDPTNWATMRGRHWWARTGSNRRPLVCKTRALPLSYAPVPAAGYTPRRPTPKTSRPLKPPTPPGRRSTTAGRGPHLADSAQRTESPRTDQRRMFRGWGSRLHR